MESFWQIIREFCAVRTPFGGRQGETHRKGYNFGDGGKLEIDRRSNRRYKTICRWVCLFGLANRIAAFRWVLLRAFFLRSLF